MPKLSSVSVGAATHQGSRPNQEDRFFVAGHFKPKHGMGADGLGRSLIGVFDGHGESEHAAVRCARRLPELLAAEPAIFGNSGGDGKLDAEIAACFQRCFRQVDDELLFDAQLKDGDRSGTTAVVALTCGNLLYTAHVGDSGAILVRDGKAARLTEDHKPTLHRESERIRERGGQIHDKSNRVMSGTESERTHLLAMSRSIGDPDFKPNGNMIVSSTPDVRVVELTPADSAVVLASDGVWDVISDHDASSIAMQAVHSKEGGNEAENCAKALVEASLANKTRDNSTAATLVLHWA